MGVPPDHPSHLLIIIEIHGDLGSPSLGHLHIYDKPMGFASTTHLGTGMHPTPFPDAKQLLAPSARKACEAWAVGHRFFRGWDGTETYPLMGF